MTEKRLPPNQQLVKGERWPVVGERSPRESDSPWTLTVTGEVVREVVYEFQELVSRPSIRRSIDVHCVTRWSKLSMQFEGLRLLDLLQLESGAPLWKESARYVSFVARSDRSHSTSLSLEDVIELDPLVALRADGRPLDGEHGGPIRMVVPGRYFYKSVKWLECIEFLSEDRLGYWEAEAGYHNDADPWKEQRYIAATISKQEAKRLIEQRDFSGRDLLSLQAVGMKLSNLNAMAAALRNADFSRAVLLDANFRESNLSNAIFHGADLRRADFRGADLEGADFKGADLRGTDLRDTSLFGTTFGNVDSTLTSCNAANVDPTTRVNETALTSLAPEQRRLLEASRQ